MINSKQINKELNKIRAELNVDTKSESWKQAQKVLAKFKKSVKSH